MVDVPTLPPIYGLFVIGPPGSGKTTFCSAMNQYLTTIRRSNFIVNLDPARDERIQAGDVRIDIHHLVTLQNVMEEFQLGPNGGLIYCMEYLSANFDWLQEKILDQINSEINKSAMTILFDLPGQVELYTHYDIIPRLLGQLTTQLHMRLCAVHLVDSFHCSNSATFISGALLSLMTMLRLELPHINVLSKMDLLHQYGSLPFNLDYYLDLPDFSRLLRFLDKRPMLAEDVHDATQDVEADVERDDHDEEENEASPFQQRFAKLHELICDVLDDFSLVSFVPVDIQDAESMARLLARVDKCNGFVFEPPQNPVASSSSSMPPATSTTSTSDPMRNHAVIQDVLNSAFSLQYEDRLDLQEKYS